MSQHIEEHEITQAPLDDGTVYSTRKGVTPFHVSPVEDYIPIVGEQKIEKLEELARKLKGVKLMEVNSTAVGGGVAEMLYSQVPFLNELGIEDYWKIVHGSPAFYEVTKNLHNLLQGKKGILTPDMVDIYYHTLEETANIYAEDHCRYKPDVEIMHDPQPLGLARYLKQPGEKWLWRFHIDVEEETLEEKPALWEFITFWATFYDAVIFSGAHYVIGRWPLQKYIIPPFIDPLSSKNKEMDAADISRVLQKYKIDPGVPILAQLGRFDPWKGIDTSINAYRLARKEEPCQLIVAGNMAADDPQGGEIFNRLCEDTRDDPGILILRLSDDVEENALEVNALQRAARIVLQPSTREGFGLVITEAMWKNKPVITRKVGAIPLQVRNGETGFFINSTKKAAGRIVFLLRNPEMADEVGREAHDYVRDHFLMPDRVADYLRVVNYFVNGEVDVDSITSYHPWYKLEKRRT